MQGFLAKMPCSNITLSGNEELQIKRKDISMKIVISFFASIATVLSFAATPQVKNVKAFQQYPWGKVCLTYEVVGDIAASVGSGKKPLLIVTAKDRTTGRICAESADVYLSGDTGTAAGLHKVFWDIDAQGVVLNSNNIVFSIMYCDDVYLVINLSGGENASSYPVSYLGAVPTEGWTDDYKTTKLVLRRIEAGSYNMQNESSVTITKPFYIGIFEMTQKQYQLVTGGNPSRCSGDTRPVEKVGYNDIRGSSNGAGWPISSAVDSDSFIGRLRTKTGLNFDLPTEAQWEYACRAGTTTTYYWGDSYNDNYAWYKTNSGDVTHIVGTKKANAWGLYDMSGNVSEWCLDWYGTLEYGTDPGGPFLGCSQRVLRGGTWMDYPKDCTSFVRVGKAPTGSPIIGEYTLSENGFRLVRTL